jgi:hypothetical protein
MIIPVMRSQTEIRLLSTYCWTKNKDDGTFVLDYDTYGGGAGAPFAIGRGSIFLASGLLVNDGTIEARGMSGYYHSSSAAGSSDRSYHMTYGSVGISGRPNDASNRSDGQSVRCIKN